MQQIIKFIEKYKYFLLFLFLQLIAFFFTIQSHSYHRSKFINSANTITGGIYKKSNSVNEFFNLKSENERLTEENAYLKYLLAQESIYNDSLHKIVIDTTKYFHRYNFIPGKIYNNSYTKRNNYLTINRGEKDGVFPEMGVVNSKGIVGVTKNTSKHYATVISILNEYSLIHAKFKKNNHFGTLTWDGKDYRVAQLQDIPREAFIEVGDTIITGGRSTIFPEGILVGTVKGYNIRNNVYQTINVELFNDMGSLKNINIISNLHKTEIELLEATNDE